MISRRDFLQVSMAAAAIWGAGAPWAKLAAQQKLTQDELLAFEPLGNVTLVHLTDIHAQLVPVYFREPSANIGVGEAKGVPPHLTGDAFQQHFGIKAGSPDAYALTYNDFSTLAETYGRMGGIDRIATVLKSIRAARNDKVLFLDGGDTWQGSYTSLKTNAGDMVNVMNALTPDAMTGHWEFTYGADRVKELKEELPFSFLGQNIFDNEWEEPAFDAMKMFERGGAKIAVIGQAFPYTPIANPRWMFPSWSFGIREELMQQNVDKARENGADVVVLLSHNGFDVDRKLAGRVKGIDVLLTCYTHDAIPAPEKIGDTLLIASGSNGKFLSRIDLDVRDGKVRDYSYKLIPIFSDVIAPDAEITDLVEEIRAPYASELKRVIGKTDSLLYRRGNFNGTFDDLICQALLEQRDAEISLSPGFRWGTSLLPGQEITIEDLYNHVGMTYPAAYRNKMTGKFIKEILEDVADNLFNPDPYYQQGGDMVRVGGLGYAIDVSKKADERITNLVHQGTGNPIEPEREYVVAGWASVNEATEGPPIWDVVENYLKANPAVSVAPNNSVSITGT
ncbi:MAG: thiosulfohydrolase SoxB [Hyphomicrobiales bacterium]